MTTRKTVVKVARRFLLGLLVLVVLLPLIFPLYWMATSGLKTRADIFRFPPELVPDPVRLENIADLFTLAPFAQQYLNSVYIGVANVIGVLVVSSVAGYAFARIRFPMRTALFVLLLTALLMPEEITIVPMVAMMTELGWIGTHLPLLILPMFTAQAIVGTFLMRQFYLSLPAELEEAGIIDGLGRFGLFVRIALPLSGSALATLAILSFLGSWNAFLEPLIFLGGRTELLTLPIAIQQFTNFEGAPSWQHQLAAATLSVIPMIVVFMFAQRYFIRGIARSGITGT